MATIVGDVTGLQPRHHPQNIPHLVKKIKGFPLKVKSFQNTATYPKLRGGVPSTPPPPCTTVGVWICLYVRWLILIVWPRSVVTLRVLSSGSVLVLHFQKAPDNSKLISSSSILSIVLLSLEEGGSKLSSLRIQPFLIHSFPAQWMDVSAECFRRRLYSQATNYWEVRKTKKDRLMTG